jgi:hypothetical protein
MPYLVHTFEDVEAYLRNLPDISEDARGRVIEAYLRDLAEHADHYVSQAPVAPESSTFQYEYVLVDQGRGYHFRFIVDGSGMPFGVVQVIYVDCEVTPVHGF